MASGNIGVTTNNSHINGNIAWSSSPNTEGNYSDVTATLRLSRNNNYTTHGNGSWSIIINGVKKTVSLHPYIKLNSNTFIISNTVRVYHNSDGSKAINISVSGGISGTSYSATYGSGTVVLNTIPRASSVSLSASSITIGNAVNIKVSRASSSFTHTLTYKFGSASGTIASGVSTSKSWTLPASLINKIPNSSSGVGTIYCYTYSGETHIGTKTCTFTAVVPSNIVPSFDNLVVERIDNDVPAVWGMYVKTKSACKLKIVGAKGTYGSTIKNYSISGGGYSSKSSELTTGILNISGSIAFTAKITDSRGRTATKTQSITVIDYHPPTINSINLERCLHDGALNAEGTYIKCDFVIDFASCNDNNSISSKVQYCLKGASDYSQAESVENGSVCCGGNISINNTYNVKFSATDHFSTTEYILKIPTSFCTWDARKGGKGFAVGKASEKEAFECAMQAEFTKGLYVNGGASMFNPQYVPNGTDFNTLTKAGFYYNDNGDDCKNMVNCPHADAFLLEVTNIGENIIRQVFYPYDVFLGTFERGFYSWREQQWDNWFCKYGIINRVPLNLINGWVNYKPYYGMYAEAKMVKYACFVKLEGLIIRGGNTKETILVLPQGSQPTDSLIFKCACAGGYADLYIHSNGNVDLENWTGNPNGWLSLDNIMFYVGY